MDINDLKRRVQELNDALADEISKNAELLNHLKRELKSNSFLVKELAQSSTKLAAANNNLANMYEHHVDCYMKTYKSHSD